MSWMRKVHDWFFPPPSDLPQSSTAELREAQELRIENQRHVRAIERHVINVSERIRSEAREADRRIRP